MPLLDLLKLDAEPGDDLEWDHDAAVAGDAGAAAGQERLRAHRRPRDFEGTLRDYQRRGVAWLQYLERLGLNPCLADDMGLGKTLEVIACLLMEREEATQAGATQATRGRTVGSEDVERLPPTLVIAPTSVLGNWRKEIERFAPQLRTLVHQGSARQKDEQTFGGGLSGRRCRPDLLRAGAAGREAPAGRALASRGGG